MKRLNILCAVIVLLLMPFGSSWAQSFGDFYYFPSDPELYDRHYDVDEEVTLKGRAILDVTNVKDKIDCLVMRIQKDGGDFTVISSDKREDADTLILDIDKTLFLNDAEGEHMYEILFMGEKECPRGGEDTRDDDIELAYAWRYDWNQRRNKLGAPGWDVGDGIVLTSTHPEWFVISDPPYELFIEVYGMAAERSNAWGRIKRFFGRNLE